MSRSPAFPVGGAEAFLVYVFKQRNYNVDTERNILEIWATSNGGVIWYATLLSFLQPLTENTEATK